MDDVFRVFGGLLVWLGLVCLAARCFYENEYSAPIDWRKHHDALASPIDTNTLNVKPLTWL